MTIPCYDYEEPDQPTELREVCFSLFGPAAGQEPLPARPAAREPTVQHPALQVGSGSLSFLGLVGGELV